MTQEHAVPGFPCGCHRAAFWVAGLPVTVEGHSAVWQASFTQQQWQWLLLARLRVKTDREKNQSSWLVCL